MSQTVAHLAWERITPTRPVADIVTAVLEVVVDLIFELAESFIDDLESSQHSDASAFRMAMP